MKILSLDIANRTGWATENASGVWNLTPKKDESKGMSLLRFRSKLEEVTVLENIDIIVFERPAGMHKSSIISQSEKHGVLKAYCEENKIQYKAYSAGEIKKHATGKGNCGKPAMVAAAKEKWPEMHIIDDNHADALFMLDLAKEDFKYLV